jgi:hypothetical protein
MQQPPCRCDTQCVEPRFFSAVPLIFGYQWLTTEKDLLCFTKVHGMPLVLLQVSFTPVEANC